MWKQRAKLHWFKEGDRNTSYFHAKASSWFQKNSIVGIFDEQENWEDDELAVAKVFEDYYSKFFTSTSPTDFSEILDAVQTKVTPEMNGRLVKEFLPQEVHCVLKQMFPLKALGLDGMLPL